MENVRSNRRFYSLVWLSFLIYPVLGIFEKPRQVIEYIYGLTLILVFVGVFFWAYFMSPWIQSQHVLRLPSMVGMVWTYCTFGLLFPLIGWNGLGLLIYAAAFAGAQRSFVPSLVATGISFVFAMLLVLGVRTDVFLPIAMVIFSAVAAISNHTSYRELETQRLLQSSRAEVARVAQIAERERIARDLHDLLGHTLSLIVLKSELASKLAEKNPSRATQEIREIERIARESLQEVRQAVRGYRNVGLNGELENAALALKTKGINFEPLLDAVQLEWATEQALTFCLRESITNIVRHSQAKRCWITLEQQADGLRFEIWDDGNGHIQEGNGIRGMRERIFQLGGQLEVQSWEGSTGVQIQMPNRPKQEFA